MIVVEIIVVEIIEGQAECAKGNFKGSAVDAYAPWLRHLGTNNPGIQAIGSPA